MLLFLLWATNPFRSLNTFSSSFIGDPVCVPSNRWLWASTFVFARHWHSLTGDSYIRVLSAKSCCICKYLGLVVVYWMGVGGSLWMVLPSVSAPNFVSVTPSMGILFPILRRNKVSTLWSSFFLSFMRFANCIMGILSFWENSHLSVLSHFLTGFRTTSLGMAPPTVGWALSY